MPARWLPVVLNPARKETVPFPAPLAPEVTVNHGALLEAVHGHPEAVFTDTLPR